MLKATTNRYGTLAAAVSTICASALLGYAPAGHAETAPGAADARTLEEVVVTAQKREQTTIDVPASVTAISGLQLLETGATRLEDYVSQIPGVSVTALTRGYTSVVIRGISTGISQATPSTAYYIDDAPIGSINAYATGGILTPDLDPFDLKRVEVLKGPQGTLYGASAVGGLVHYVTVEPDSTRVGGAVSLGFNNVDHGGNGYEARGAVNLPLVENSMALRLSGFDRDEAGYIDNPITGANDVNKAITRGGRVAFGWTVSPDWSVLAWAMTQRFKAGGIGVEDDIAPGFTPAEGPLEHGSYVQEKQATGIDVGNVTVKGHVSGVELVSSTTYQKVSANTLVDVSQGVGSLLSLLTGIPGIGAQTHQTIDTKRWSQELRASSQAIPDKLGWEVGFFYTNEDSRNALLPEPVFLVPSLTPLPLGPLANAEIVSKYQEYAPFANVTYDFTSQFEMTAGLRFSRTEQQYHQDYEAAILSPVPVLIDQDVSANKLTYLVSARYKPTRDTAVYARLANGYRAGGPSALPPGIVPGGRQSFDPDTLTSAELGIKSSFLNGLVSIDAAVFATKWKNVQIQTHAGNYQYFVNGGDAKSQGAELTVLWRPLEGLSVRATGGYTDSKLSEDAPAAGGLNGDRMPFVPQWTASLLPEYRVTFGDNLQAWFGGSLGYIGSRVSNFSGKNALPVPSYTTFGLNAGLALDRVTVTVYGKNLGDTRGINFANNVGLALPVVNPLGNPYLAGIIEPRTLGIDVSYRF